MTRAAKRVDRLKLVADDGHVIVSGGHQLYDLRLEFVRVLILVDHDVAILVRQPLAHSCLIPALRENGRADRRKSACGARV